MSTTSRPNLLGRVMLPLTVLSVALAGCSGPSQPSQSTSRPSTPAQSQSPEAGSPQTADGFCGAIGTQMESLNFFPLTLSSKSGGSASLQEMEKLQTGAPPAVQNRMAALEKTMEKGVKDPDAFNRGKFIEAKIQVEDWILSNC